MNKPSNISLEFPFSNCNECDNCKVIIEEDTLFSQGINLYRIKCEHESICCMWKCKLGDD